MTTRGLVLGGGGITGIAWEFGVIKGLADKGVNLAEADTVLGTSAGSVVGTLLLSYDNVDDLFERSDTLADPALGGKFSLGGMLKFAPTMARPVGHVERRVKIGAGAVRTHPVGSHDRVEIIRERIDVDDWPDGDLRITAVNVDTGKLTVFTRHSGVDIVHAIAASCAVPFVWPAVSINDDLYMDGGMRSPTNADLLTGYRSVLVLAPVAIPLVRYHNTRVQLDRGGAAHKRLIQPDAASRKVIGRRVLDPSRAADAAEAGIAQGERYAERLGEFWSV